MFGGEDDVFEPGPVEKPHSFFGVEVFGAEVFQVIGAVQNLWAPMNEGAEPEGAPALEGFLRRLEARVEISSALGQEARGEQKKQGEQELKQGRRSERRKFNPERPQSNCKKRVSGAARYTGNRQLLEGVRTLRLLL